MLKLTKTEKNIYQLYLKEPKIILVANVKELIASYWIIFDRVNFPITLDKFKEITTPETITRAGRELRNKLQIEDDLANRLEAEVHHHYAI